MRNLERFQRKVVSWITNSKTLSYIEQLRLSNLLPLPMYYQLNDLLLLSSLQQNQSPNTKQPVLPGNRSMRRDDYFDLTKKRLEKSRGEFFIRTQKKANRLHHSIDFGNRHGLKHSILNQTRNDIMMRYKPENVCTWQICYDWQHCRDTFSKTVLIGKNPFCKENPQQQKQQQQ